MRCWPGSTVARPSPRSTIASTKKLTWQAGGKAPASCPGRTARQADLGSSGCTATQTTLRTSCSRGVIIGYDAQTRPADSILQALLLTRHLLFVGASLNDDSVSRLAYEVRRFRQKHDREDKVGTYLDVDALPARRELWGEQLEWIDLPGARFEDRARMMEVLLDAVAAYAATDATWLLDKRFSGLPPDGRAPSSMRLERCTCERAMRAPSSTHSPTHWPSSERALRRKQSDRPVV